MNRKNEMEQEYSQAKGIIIVPLKLLAKIDLNRDTLSRADFIEQCINALMEQGDGESDVSRDAAGFRPTQPSRAENNAVSRTEFGEFKENIKDLLQSCIEYLPDQVVEPLARATGDAQERFKRLEELLEQLDH